MSGIYLFDRNQKLIDTIEEKRLIDPYQELELNSLIRAEFTCKYVKEIEQAYYFGFKDDDNFYLHTIRNTIKKDGFLTDQGVHIMFDELKGKVVRDLRPQNKTPGYALGKALEGTGWTCISHVDNLASTNFYYISALDALYKVCSVWKVEFKPVIKFIDGKISAKEIHLYPSTGNDLGRVFSYGNNLVSVLAETNKDDLYTAFIGRGKGEEIVDEKGQATGGYGRKIKFTDIDFIAEKDGIKVHSPKGFDYIEIEEATKIFGYPDGTPRITTVDFDDIEDKEELAKATFNFALENCRPKVQLRSSGLDIEQVGLGEIVTIIADMDIRFKTRVFKIKKNILSKSVVSFEFGDKIIKTTADRLKSAQVEKNNETVQQIDYMEQVLRAIESTYYNEDGYQYDLKADNEYNLPAGIYSFDRPIDKNPTKVIYLGAGKLMIADSKKEDGSWKFTTAINGESVNADTIRTGILEGGRVFWNFNDGTFRIGESKEKFSMLWDGETLKLRNVDIDLSNNYQIGEINKQIEENTNNFNSSIVNLDDKISGLSSSVDTKISNVTGKIESIEQDFKVGQGELESSINTKIKDLSADVEVNFKDVNERIAGNVTGIANLSSQIKQTESSITQTVESQIASVNDKISSESESIKSYVQNNYSSKIQTTEEIASEVFSLKNLIISGDKDTRSFIERNYSTTTQTNDKIASEVKDIKTQISNANSDLKTYVSKNYSTKTQTANLIESKVSSINSRLGDAESRITQTSNKIDSEISSVKSTASSNYNALSSRISQTDSKIESRVTSSEARSIFRQEASSFTFDADQVNFNSDVDVSGNFRSKGSSYYGDIYTELYNGWLEFELNNRNNIVGRIGVDDSGLYINAPEKIMIKCGDSFIEMKPNKMSIGCWGGEVVVHNFVDASV
jgi:phage minor structural protein